MSIFDFLKKRAPDHGPRTMLETAKNLGFAAHHIVDVGGNRGGWSRDALAVFPDAKITMFEPQENLADFHKDLAASANVTIHYRGVGDTDGTQAFTEYDRDDSSSFIYSAAEAEALGMKRTEIEICKLDTILPQSSFGPADVIKIDAEGYDLKVLDGAAETLEKAQIVLVEAAVACPTYPNTVTEVFGRLDALGFRLFDITDLNRGAGGGVLWLIEAAFVRKDSPVDIAAQNIA